MREEIDATDRLIAALGRQSVGVRPPFGDWAAWLPEATGGQPVVLWDVVSGDAGGHISADAMVNNGQRRRPPGFDRRCSTSTGEGRTPRGACPGSSAGCAPAGLRFVRVSELLAWRAAEIVKAQPQRYKKRELAPPLAPEICRSCSVCRTNSCTITRPGEARPAMRIRKARPSEARRQADWIVAIAPWRGLGYQRAGAGPLAGPGGEAGLGAGGDATATR